MGALFPDPAANSEGTCLTLKTRVTLWSQARPNTQSNLCYFLASLTWDWLLFQMEHLKACAEIAAQRTINWQKFCIKDDGKRSSLGCTVTSVAAVYIKLRTGHWRYSCQQNTSQNFTVCLSKLGYRSTEQDSRL